MPSQTSIQDDSALLASVLAGDPTAVGRLLTYAEDFARAHLRGFIPNAAHDDVVNGFLAHLWDRNWRRLGAWRGDAPLAHYLARLFRHYQVDFRRELNRQAAVMATSLEDAPLDPPTEDPADLPEAALATLQLRDCLDKGIDRVTPNQRELIRLRHEESLMHREIALRLDRAMGTIASNLADAERALMRRMMGDCAELLEDIVGVQRRNSH